MLKCFFITLFCFTNFCYSQDSIEVQWDKCDFNKKMTLEQISKFKDLEFVIKTSDKFVNLFILKQFDKFFEELSNLSPYPKEELDAIKISTISHFKNFENRIGNILGFEFSGVEKISKSLVKVTYFIKGSSFPSRLIFYFYKPVDKWLPYTFFYDYSLEKDLTLFQISNAINSMNQNFSEYENTEETP